MRKLEEIIRELPENIRGPIYEAFIAFRDDIILKETREIKAEIGKVWEVIKEIAESQKRTEQEIEKIWSTIKELTEAQKRTEQEIEKICGVIKELAEAQKRTEQRLNELAEAQKRTEQRVEELAQAQKETEQKIKELTEAQKKTEQKIKELTEAQRKTEETLKKLIEEHSKTREKLEGLSHSFGYLLEDRAMKSLPKILKRKYNIRTVGNFVRDYFTINGEHVEVNIFGKVKKGNKEYILIGEAKSQVTKKAIDKFLKKCDKISRSFSK
jgi:chromosome segregation ATPase